MVNSETGSPLIRIHPLDNVAVLRRAVGAGETLVIDGLACPVSAALALGHKVALKPIRAEGKIFKYGEPIGSATHDIGVGEHVHVHNMRSDYLATFTLEEGRKHGTAH